MLPVFCLGVVAALTYARTRSLLGPMLAHAAYNAGIIAIQVFLHWSHAVRPRPTSAIGDLQVVVCS